MGYQKEVRLVSMSLLSSQARNRSCFEIFFQSIRRITWSLTRKLRAIIVLVLLLTLTNFAFGQTPILVKGMVADSATFNALSYVNIVVKSKLKGTQSGDNGSFSVFATPADTLIFSFVGYKTKEIPVAQWEPGIVLMSEDRRTLKTITIESTRVEKTFYENIFSDQHALWKKQNGKLPFYLSKEKKEEKKLALFKNEKARTQTYVEIVVLNEDLKMTLMKKYSLDEKQYYELLAKFNEQNHTVMYYLSAAELLSLVYRFYESNANR